MIKEKFFHFVESINQHQPELISALITDDHQIIDSHGTFLTGKAVVLSAWTEYFRIFPDYQIEISGLLQESNTIAAFGYAGEYISRPSTSKGYWKIPAAWKVEFTDSMISKWQIYADTKIPYDVIRHREKQQSTRKSKH